MKQLKSGCDLSVCMLCRLCVPEWKGAIDIHREHRQYRKGELIFKEGEVMDGIYFVYSGAVKVHQSWGDDKELIVRFAAKGDILGHRGLGKENVYPISATALAETTVCFLNNSFFHSSLQVNQKFLYELMMFFAGELQTSERKMRNLVHMQVKNRLAGALLQLEQQFGIDNSGAIDMQLSRQDLASFVGTSYETLFRMLSELTADNYILQSPRQISILDKGALQALTKIP